MSRVKWRIALFSNGGTCAYPSAERLFESSLGGMIKQTIGSISNRHGHYMADQFPVPITVRGRPQMNRLGGFLQQLHFDQNSSWAYKGAFLINSLLLMSASIEKKTSSVFD